MGKRIGIYLVGLALNALGIALIIFSAVGAGAWDTAAIGLNHRLSLTIGTCTVIIQVLIVLLTAWIERKRPQYESMIAIVIRSMFLDAWMFFVFMPMTPPVSWETQWFYFLAGIAAMGVGIGIYVEAHFPKAPIDGLMLAIQQRFRLTLNMSRIIVELSGAFIGFLLGGPVGLGTLMIALFVGKIIQATNNQVKKMLQREPVPTKASSIK